MNQLLGCDPMGGICESYQPMKPVKCNKIFLKIVHLLASKSKGPNLYLISVIQNLFDIWMWFLCTKSCDGLLASSFGGLETQLIRPLPQSSWRMAAQATRMKRWRRAWWWGVVGISRISCNLYLEVCFMSSNFP